METKIRMAAVEYSNTKPLIYGFEQGLMANEITLVTDYPANIATMLIAGEVDIALVPIATLPMLPAYYVVTDYCIAAEGEVASVCLFSDVPIERITTILMDYQSKTSVGLLKILLKNYWQVAPTLLQANVGYESTISGTTAGLVIGDRAFAQRLTNRYVYDLGSAWLKYTQMPIVFAVWVANKVIDNKLLQKINEVMGFGFTHLPAIIAANASPHYDLHKYYTQNISYNLTKQKLLSIELYLQKLTEL